ncbi:MAG: reprolysin-like metallopeptidase [Acidobacteriota bacterium]
MKASDADWPGQEKTFSQPGVFQLNRDGLEAALRSAPMEGVGKLANSPAVLTLPMPDGKLMQFRIEESPVMEPGLAARFPEVKSYRGQGLDDPAMTMRCDLSPQGFHALVLSVSQTIYIHPANAAAGDSAAYAIDSGSGDQDKQTQCLVEDVHKVNPGHSRTISPEVAVGSTLRTYRIAIAATWEYCNAYGGGTNAGTVASLNTWLNGANAVYERELAVHLNLVNDTDIFYTTERGFTAGTDPFTNDNVSTLLNEVRPVLRDQVGQANYDVGHVLGQLGFTGASGVAFIGAVCNNANQGGLGPLKGGGATQVGGTVGNSTALGVWVHELGHLFGASHSFNGTVSNCTQRNTATSYESGSGETIMSYSGICGADNITNSRDMRFHVISFDEITSYLASATGAGCGATSSTGNSPPTVGAGPDLTIPKNTPFTLTATGSDADVGDALTYAWDQYEAGGASYPQNGTSASYNDAADPSTTTRPIFRPFPASSSPSRTFPLLTYILNNANDPPDTVGGLQTAEELPRVGRNLKFRVMIRDNRAGGGGANEDEVMLAVAGGAGPFLVTAPESAVSWAGGTTQTVSWSVNNTNIAPVSCANVKISLSTNGGATFPIVLAASTPNDGSETVVIPTGLNSTTARIKVEAVGNIFFDISGVNFTVTPGSGCTFSINPTSQIFTALGGSGSVAVTAGTGCAWTAISIDLWINVTSGSAGSGNGTVGYTVAANTGAARTGTITIAGQTFTVTQGCVVTTITTPPVNQTVCAGLPVSFSVIATGAGTLTYQWRKGAVNIPGATSSSYSISAATTNDAGSYDVVVTAACGSITSNTVTLTVNTQPAVTTNPANQSVLVGGTASFTAAASGTPTPSVQWQVSTNGGGSYSNIAGATSTTLSLANVTLAQNGNRYRAVFTNSCGTATTTGAILTVTCQTITVNPATIPSGTTGVAYSQVFTQTGGSGTVTFTLTGALPAGWSFSGATLSGTTTQPGNFPITVMATDVNGCSGSRGYTLVINCGFAINPASQTFTPSGGSGSVSVAAGIGCSWTATSNATWINVTGGASGTGNGTVNYTVAANSGAGRTGTITIAGQTFTITQAGTCTLTINPASQTFTASGGSGSVAVTGATGCTWIATSNAAWITITGGASGNGNGTVAYSVAANTGVARTGTATIAGQTFTVTQSAAPCPAITVNPASLPNGTVGAGYSQMLTATGGTPTYGFTVSAGALPAGLNLSSGGSLSGTPTTAGTFTFTIKATDANGCMGTRAYTVIISGNGLMFYPLPRPVRLLDTRAGQGNCDNISTPVAGGASITTPARVTCEGITIPSTAQAIVGNLTVINQTAQTGYLTIYPDGQAAPLAANMVYEPGQILSNNFTVGLSDGGAFNVFAERTIDLVVDISGYYAPPGAGGLYYHPLSKPIRLLDTRAGQGNCDSVGTPIAEGTTFTTLARIGCEGLAIPTAAQAIIGNATAINGSGQSGYLTIYPNGVPVPLSATMVYFPGQIISNAFTSSLSAAGEFNIFSERTVDMVVDVAGYYSAEATDVNGAGLLFTPLSRPLRILDTRPGQGNCDNVGTPIAGGTSIATPGRLTCEGITIPAAARTILGNITVINQTSLTGFLTLYPDGVAQPLSANMIYTPGQLISNAFVVGVNAGTGQYRIFGERTIDAIVDVSGYFAP